MSEIIPPNGSVIALLFANGESLTQIARIDGKQLVGIITPAAWTAAVMTFKASADGSAFCDVYDDATERSIASATIGASRFLALDPLDWLGMKHLQLRSGTSASPVNQGAARALQLVVADPGNLR